jgi:hypothetical protein
MVNGIIQSYLPENNGHIIVLQALSAGAGWFMQSRQFMHEEKMHAIANQGKDAIKAILLEMLNHKSYTDRSFSALRERIGGYTDDELRKLLHELGARKTSRDVGSEEWWYLESRKQERIEKKQSVITSWAPCMNVFSCKAAVYACLVDKYPIKINNLCNASS